MHSNDASWDQASLASGHRPADWLGAASADLAGSGIFS